MKKQQSGFTLIELIAVLVILGILAATAVPRFIDLSDEASVASLNNIAGAIESASALNHAVDIANESGLSSDDFEDITACNLTNVNSLLQNSLADGTVTTDSVDGFVISGAAAIADKATATCTISRESDSSTTASFTLIGAEA